MKNQRVKWASLWLTCLLLITGGCKKREQLAPPMPLISPLLSPLASPSAETGEFIMFISDRDGVNRHYLMNPDGSEVRPLAFSLPGQLIEGPHWIPELGLFAGIIKTDEGQDIYLIGWDGNIVKNLTNTPQGFEADPTYSPRDGGIFIFTCVYWDLDICTIHLDGTGLSNLTNHPARDSNPAWSPSGTYVAFVSNRGGIPDIYRMNADGSDLVNLTVSNQPDIAPSWSPDETQILFQSQRDGNWEIYLMNADGQNPVNLTKNPACDSTPRWSPDGMHIAFLSDRSGKNQLYIMQPNGADARQLSTDPEGQVLDFIWSPDSQYLVYTLAVEGRTRLFKIAVDGSTVDQLTDDASNAASPVWISFP